MQRKSYVIMLALAAGLIMGAVFAPTLRGVTASAQTAPATPTPTAPNSTTPATPRSNLFNSFLDQLAAALNIQRSTLDSAITTAGTKTADQAVTDGTLTQAQGDALKGRLQSGDLGALFGRGGGRGGPMGGPMGGKVAGLRDAMLAAAAQTLGITTDELNTQLQSGQTLAQLAQAHGTTEQAVTDAALAAAKTQLDQAVAAGTLTQAQADQFYSRLQQDGANLIGPHGGRGHGDHARPDAPTTPQTPATPAPSSSADM